MCAWCIAIVVFVCTVCTLIVRRWINSAPMDTDIWKYGADDQYRMRDDK